MARALEPFVQRVVAEQLGRPARIVPDPRVGRKRDVGIDQGGAAEATADQHVHVAPDVQIEEARAPSFMSAVQGVLKFGQRLGRRVGKLADRDFASALEHRHRQAHPGEP
jgi:hypothetical protein